MLMGCWRRDHLACLLTSVSFGNMHLLSPRCSPRHPGMWLMVIGCNLQNIPTNSLRLVCSFAALRVGHCIPPVHTGCLFVYHSSQPRGTVWTSGPPRPLITTGLLRTPPWNRNTLCCHSLHRRLLLKRDPHDRCFTSPPVLCKKLCPLSILNRGVESF